MDKQLIIFLENELITTDSIRTFKQRAYEFTMNTDPYEVIERSKFFCHAFSSGLKNPIYREEFPEGNHIIFSVFEELSPEVTQGTDGKILKYIQDFVEHPSGLEYFAKICNSEMLKWIKNEEERKILHFCNSIVVDFADQEIISAILELNNVFQK